MRVLEIIKIAIYFAMLSFFSKGFSQEAFRYCTFDYELRKLSQARSSELIVFNEFKTKNIDPSIEYIIPTVIHVFHDGDFGRLGLDQILSGLETINTDFAGLNNDWNDIDPQFDQLKAKMNLRLELTRKDPTGLPTSGVIYYDDVKGSRNEIDLYEYGWNTERYLNIYLPIHVYGEPSVRTAYASLPIEFYIGSGRDGIYYSSVRWGYGSQSELNEDSELASIATHEVGHWLGLYHTFRGGCGGSGDFVRDTPPAIEEPISLDECPSVSESCGELRNIENYMDYYHNCKKMFTQDQVTRMINVLQEPFRKKIWSTENLIYTGIINTENTLDNDGIVAFQNSNNELIFQFLKNNNDLKIANSSGQVIFDEKISGEKVAIPTQKLEFGLLFYFVYSDEYMKKGKVIIK